MNQVGDSGNQTINDIHAEMIQIAWIRVITVDNVLGDGLKIRLKLSLILRA